jgi:hypothetical protein
MSHPVDTLSTERPQRCLNSLGPGRHLMRGTDNMNLMTADGWVTFYTVAGPGRTTMLIQKRDGATRTILR